MLASDLKVEKKEAMDYAPLPEDVYQVELLDITSEVKPTYDTRNKPDPEKEYETVLNFQFVVLDGQDDKGESLRGRNIFENFVPTFLYISKKNGKNKLYKITEALMGRELTPEDEAYMDGAFLNTLIGRQLRIGTIIKKDGDKSYTNIDKYLRAGTLINALTDEEKEKSKIKPKDDGQKAQGYGNAVDNMSSPDDINPEDIPF
jgi:hypothetical protein